MLSYETDFSHISQECMRNTHTYIYIYNKHDKKVCPWLDD